jgi:hypothetical protein
VPFSAVAWSYGDVATSAKLAQMEENVRTHDHRTADQGGQLGLRASASGEATGVAASLAASSLTTAAISFPAGRFANPPRVYVTLKSGGQVRYRRVLGRAATTSGFTLSVYSGASPVAAGGLTVGWVAVDAP